MTLTLTLREPPPGRVDGSALTPEHLRGRSGREIGALQMRCGRELLRLGDLFAATGTGGDDLFVLGDCSRVDRIGAGMGGGRILVNGPSGDHLGAGMRGGEIMAVGDVGDWAGAAMAGGALTVRGDVGARLGGAYPGARAGMTGGEIVVSGDAGEEVGAGMRRGLVAVSGTAGPGAGLRMLAGTMIALGGTGPEAGLGNRRGSIVSGAPTPLLPGYRFATRDVPPALRLQLRELRKRFLPIDDALIDGTWQRWSGDGCELNRGEILIFDDEESRTR